MQLGFIYTISFTNGKALEITLQDVFFFTKLPELIG
jgi:hypothetical protein